MVAFLASLTGAAPARAHVALDEPNGGEVLIVGSQALIEWRVEIPHNLENWDLWYSASGPDGPWLDIVMDLPAGDPTAQSIHTYMWMLPDDPSTTVRVRVRMDNVGPDYFDISDADLTIEPGLPENVFEDGFESGDTSVWSLVIP